jgi:energy-coupling factor transporter ATP-binding protein EcfA2
MPAISSSLIRIRRSDKSVVGMGCLVKENYILTCAHVVARSLGLHDTPVIPPEGTVLLDFPLVEPGKMLTAHIVLWQKSIGQREVDIAGLQISGRVPAGAVPIEMLLQNELWGHSFQTFGCPDGHPDGVWASGVIRGEQASGWVHLEDVKVPGFEIGPGFSGAPVWDESDKGTVGMIVAAEQRRDVKVAFMIPTRTLLENWGVLGSQTYVLKRDVSAPTALTTQVPIHLQVFLFSPSDVSSERGLALRVIERLPYDPFLHDLVTLKAVSWENSSAKTPALSSMSPKEAEQRGTPNPSECDIFVMVLWGQMGPLLSSEYALSEQENLSIGEWLFNNALGQSDSGGRPIILIYHRTEKILLNPDDSSFDDALLTYRRLQSFLSSRLTNSDGTLRRSWVEYEDPPEFQDLFEYQLKEFIARIRNDIVRGSLPFHATQKIPLLSTVGLWQGSPFPGLRALGPEDALIFFGRERETDEVTQLIESAQMNFVGIVGASGSGKSSLVGAGIIPRLKENAVVGSKDWYVIKFTPGEVSDDPFVALAIQLLPLTEKHKFRPRELVEKLHNSPSSIIEICDSILDSAPPWAKMVLFIDQFEELFTLIDPDKAAAFIEMVSVATTTGRFQMISTIRADFYSQCVEWPQMAALLRGGSYPLAAADEKALYEMITRPAARAGLKYEGNLADLILEDVGSDPGALALMAYALDELHRACKDHSLLTFDAYESIGGVQGAIGTRAEKVFNELNERERSAFGTTFSYLLDIRKNGRAVRRKGNLAYFARDTSATNLISALTEARLLIKSRDNDGNAIVEIAHDALLEKWPKLTDWIATTWRSREARALSDQDHTGEMGRRRYMALERQAPGPVFLPEWGRDDGRYCSIVISEEVFIKIIDKLKWFSDKTPGKRSRRVNPLNNELKNIIFRLRGIEPGELRQIVAAETKLIGEFWPNAQTEDFRGITFVTPDVTKWRQDLIPRSARVYLLTIKSGILWLELSDKGKK